MRNKCEANHVLYRDGVYYYVRRVPYGLTSHYDVKRLCFSLKTKSDDAPVLPVHDSFIMHYAFGEELGELEEAMRRAFYE